MTKKAVQAMTKEKAAKKLKKSLRSMISPSDTIIEVVTGLGT